jgi:polygalacturonase
MRIRYFSAISVTLLFVAAVYSASAQDTRNVTEPRIPMPCVTLNAQLEAHDGQLAPADEQKLDTARIQEAMERCSKNAGTAGNAVVLKAHGRRNVFLTGPLQLRSGVTLVISANTVLAASRDPRIYDLTPGSCGIVGEKGHGCKPLITADHATNSGIMGDGSIDGRGGATLLGQKDSWWDLAHEAKVTDKQQSVPQMITLRQADNFTLYRISLRNSPNFHVAVNQTNGFTAWGVKIMTPGTARNTDGIDPGSSTNVTIAYSFIHTGDDDVAIKSGGTNPASHISILHNHFYTGHGMSIGSGTSGGVDHILVDDLTIDGADNGIRIKSDRSRGGLVHDVLYRNVCIRNVKNPLLFTPKYTTFGGNLLPIYHDITLSNVRVETPGIYTLVGLDAEHKIGLQFDNVFADDLTHALMDVSNAEFKIGPRRGNLAPSGDGASTTEMPGTAAGSEMNCGTHYAEFPTIKTAPEMAGKIPDEDRTLYVAADGTGDYSSIQKALYSAPATGGLVLVSPGVYREVVTVDKPHIEIRGSAKDPSKTVLVNDLSAGTSGGTLHSATVNITADDFLAQNITFANDFNRTHPQLPQGSQALALRVIGDRAIFRNVRLLGNQDTVYAGSRNCAPDGASCISTRQYFADCYIEGNVDFIFGDAKAIFDRCEIHSTSHKGGYLTAQSKHYSDEDSGFVFNHCKLTADPAAEPQIYLGRPWRPYARVIFLHTEMGAHIDPAGWREWHPGETHSLDTAYYAEFDSTGPGANNSARDPHTHALTPEEAAQYDPAVFLAGSDHWNPTASVPPAQ